MMRLFSIEMVRSRKSTDRESSLKSQVKMPKLFERVLPLSARSQGVKERADAGNLLIIQSERWGPLHRGAHICTSYWQLARIEMNWHPVGRRH